MVRVTGPSRRLCGKVRSQAPPVRRGIAARNHPQEIDATKLARCCTRFLFKTLEGAGIWRPADPSERRFSTELFRAGCGRARASLEAMTRDADSGRRRRARHRRGPAVQPRARRLRRSTSKRRGDSALEAIRRRLPDLLVLDLMLPGLDGLELARLLQARPGDRATADRHADRQGRGARPHRRSRARRRRLHRASRSARARSCCGSRRCCAAGGEEEPPDGARDRAHPPRRRRRTAPRFAAPTFR